MWNFIILMIIVLVPASLTGHTSELVRTDTICGRRVGWTRFESGDISFRLENLAP